MKPLLSILCLSFAITFAATPGFSQTQLRQLKSREGVEISLSYGLKYWEFPGGRRTTGLLAKPLEIFVKLPSAKPGASVRVVLLNKTEARGSCANPRGFREDAMMLDLAYNSQRDQYYGYLGRQVLVQSYGRWTPWAVARRGVEPALSIKLDGECSQERSRLEVAVVVDGRWLVDPVSGNHNFKVQLAN